MLPCSACHRHVRPAATACPFCGAALSSAVMPSVMPAVLLGLAVLAACGGKDDGGTDDTTSTPVTASSTDDPGTTTTDIPTTTSASSDPSSGCATACTDATEGSGFIYGSPDAGSSPLECDVQLEDCPAGQKCMPWVDDGSNVWNALKCVPVDRDPVAVGEACQAPGGGLSGVDNCDKHVMCFEVSGNEGICRAMCDGTTCDTGFNCFVANDQVLQLCLPACDVDMPDCPPGQGCLPVLGGGVCAPA